MTTRASFEVICSSYRNKPRRLTRQGRSSIDPTSGNPSRATQSSSLARVRFSLPGSRGGSTVSKSTKGSSLRPKARFRGAHSSGSSRLKRHRSLQDPSSATRATGAAVRQTPHPEGDASVHTSSGLQGRRRSACSSGSNPAAVRSSYRTDAHTRPGTMYRSRM
jgi:hypothetical protein